MRRHWRVRHKADSAARLAASLVARAAKATQGWETAEKARISVDWYMAPRKGDGCYRPLDVQNAIGALKATVDGLVDAGVVVSDTHRHLSWGEVRLYRNAAEHGGRCELVLTVEHQS